MKIIFLFLITALVAGCVSFPATEQGLRVQISDPTEIKTKTCTDLGVVEGSSVQNGPLNQSVGQKNARNDALNQAAVKGATHMVWEDLQLGFWGIKAPAKIYKCS